MRLPSQALALSLALQASTIQAWKIADRVRINYFNDYEPYPEPVPSYNISMPVDHFNVSDTRTFNNRYFVNDTYYKPGGPVIFYDFGEAGVEDVYASVILGGWEATLSAPIELAKARNGVVIGWEHRYYGYSHPFPVIQDEEDDDYLSFNAGIPVGGAADYKYLTIEQALEDVAYFARRFNQTQLGGRNTVLSGVNATQHLDPSHTPWIWIGASYPGNRGAWMRLRNPDIIYAAWASSAPVQTVADGSAYANSIYRALPGNCTADMQAALRRIDQILEAGNKTQMSRLGNQLDLARYGDSEGYFGGRRGSAEYDMEYFTDTLGSLYSSLTSSEQGYGYTGLMQTFCDVMESFDVSSYFSNSTAHSDDDTVFLYNTGDSAPPQKGIAASNGGRGAEAALAAYLYGAARYFNGEDYGYVKRSLEPSLSGAKPSIGEPISPWQDVHSWEWQVLSELGLMVSVNASSPYALGSKYVDHAYMRKNIIKQVFGNFSESDIPAQPDNSYAMGFGGWRMRPSNTMFTNGEFDPWRAYGVASLERELADYPGYSGMREDVPQCGQADYQGGPFGLVVSFPPFPTLFV
jgi:hypothetical protein